MRVDTDSLTRQWRRAWPQCVPIGHRLRQQVSDRWVRFHSLPSGKRYPSDDAEYREVLTRFNSVLTAVLGGGDDTDIYLITVEYEPHDGAAGSEPIHVGLHPDAVDWMRVADPVDPDAVYDLKVSRMTFAPGDLDDLLRYVADDRTSDVVVCDVRLRWLLHPYDGGMDVIAPTTELRDGLTERFSAWLSERPDGL